MVGLYEFSYAITDSNSVASTFGYQTTTLTFELYIRAQNHVPEVEPADMDHFEIIVEESLTLYF